MNEHQELAKARPDAFLPDLAVDSLGRRLSAVRCPEDALDATQQAVQALAEVDRISTD